MTAADERDALLVIISGPSGVGKDTIIDALRERPHDPDYHYVVTCTTRAARPGEERPGAMLDGAPAAGDTPG